MGLLSGLFGGNKGTILTESPAGKKQDFLEASPYWDQKTGDSMCGTATDLWDTDKPGANQQPGGVNCSSKKYNPTGTCILEGSKNES